jgi:hypothetical protein
MTPSLIENKTAIERTQNFSLITYFCGLPYHESWNHTLSKEKKLKLHTAPVTPASINRSSEKRQMVNSIGQFCLFWKFIMVC